MCKLLNMQVREERIRRGLFRRRLLPRAGCSGLQLLSRPGQLLHLCQRCLHTALGHGPHGLRHAHRAAAAATATATATCYKV